MIIFNKSVSILLACCLFCVCEIVHGNQLKGLLKHRSRRTNSQLDAEEKCLCYKNKPDTKSVAEQLDKGKGLKRLVVYFFIDPHTQEIIMYVPDVEKQALLPDLSFEKGDDLKNVAKLTNENILNHHNAIPLRTPKKIDDLTPTPKRNHKNNTVYEAKYFDVPNEVNEGEDKFVNISLKLPVDNNVFENPGLSDNNIENHDFPNFDTQNGSYNDASFDNWFNNQIKAVQMDPMNSNEMDVKLLKKLIENTLNENGMMVTEGKLKYEDGNVLDMAKLQLRPILIGDSVRYDNFLQNQDKFSLPPDFPYLKSILVTIKDPSKILSIIPLGKMYLPKDAVQSPSGSPKRKISDNGTKFNVPEKLTKKENNVQLITCTGEHCQLKKGDQLIHRDHDIFTPTSNQVKPNQIKSNQYNDAEKFSIIANNLLNSETENKDKENKNELFDKNRRFLRSKKRTKYYNNDISDYSRELNQRYKTKSLKIPYLSRFHNELHVNVNKKRRYPTPLKDEISDENEAYIDDLEEPGPDDEYPGFRIMGGQPALGSGAPINMRGRSGWAWGR